MPPGKPLPPEQVQAFVDWVKMGAPDPRTGGRADRRKVRLRLGGREEALGLSAGQRSATPAVKDPAWSRTAIDRFIKAKLDEKGLRPYRRQANASFLRRVTYDLTGMPPTPERGSGLRCRSIAKSARESRRSAARISAMASTGDVTGSM